MTNDFNETEVNEVKRLAKEKLGLCRKGNDIIGMQIFSILSQFARVIYYPLGKNAPWGFTRISGIQNDAKLDKPFVAINSSIKVECQVFAAAHELYHIWFEENPDVLPADLLNEQNKEINEKKANRFAAEFLEDEFLLRQEIAIYEIEDFTIKTILQLASLFVVPYRTMVKRLYEIGALGKKEQADFLEESEEAINKYKKIYSIPELKADDRIAMDDLVELSVKAYEAGYITFEKLEHLLKMSNLKPGDLEIAKPTMEEFPSDNELDYIMEE